MRYSTLILNADASPISLVPLSVRTWQETISMIWGDDPVAVPLHHYDDWVVRSPSTEIVVPSVCILKNQISLRRIFRENGGPATSLVFLRDGFCCQYCGKAFSANSLTLDHVVPRKFHGKSIWTNLTSACFPCNGAKGHDMRIQPKVKPFRPTYGHLVKMSKRFPLTIAHPTWNYYLGWPDSLVEISSPI